MTKKRNEAVFNFVFLPYWFTKKPPPDREIIYDWVKGEFKLVKKSRRKKRR